MSAINQTAIKDEAAPASPVAIPQSDEANSNQSEIKELVASLKNLTQKRRVFRQVQVNYIRIKKTFFKHLQVSEEADKSESPANPAPLEKEKVSATHRLLRNFNYAVNV
jgi:hypothetical protein